VQASSTPILIPASRTVENFKVLSSAEKTVMSQLPLALILFFLFTALVALFLFGKATGGSRISILISVLWMVLQSAVALSGFYLVTNSLPPHLLLALAPPIVLIVALFVTPLGTHFMARVDLKWLVLLHSIRILVETNLFLLFVHKQVPALMTFEAGNLDILAGLSAPVIWWAFSSGRVGKRGLLIWNSVCLLGVLNALGRALLSTPYPFQEFGFDQPTIAIFYFPYILLPAFIVPVVLFCHAVTFRKLLME
jgi:hypothetical protein